MRDMLPPLFQILTGLIFFIVLVVGTVGRPAIRSLSGRLTAFSLIALAVSAFALSRATAATSLGAGAQMFMVAGGGVLVAGLLVAGGLLVRGGGEAGS